MTTPITSLYLAIGKAVLSQEGIAHADLYQKQPLREATELAYALPAIFVEIDLLKSELETTYNEEYSVKIHLESSQLGSTAMNSHNQMEALKPFATAEDVKFLLLAMALPSGFSRLEFLSLIPDKTGKNHPVYILSFKVNFNYRICNRF
jgi:hypothetical protein